jgi:hypothetical protein
MPEFSGIFIYLRIVIMIPRKYFKSFLAKNHLRINHRSFALKSQRECYWKMQRRKNGEYENFKKKFEKENG